MQSNQNSDFGYLNVLLNNDTDASIPAEYNQTQNQPILTNMQDFQLGIVRLKIPTSSIPLMVFQDGEYTIGFSLAGNDANVITEPVNYIIGDVNNFLSPPQNRYIYYYNQFLDCVNAALRSMWNKCLVGGGIYEPYRLYLATIGVFNVNQTPSFRLKTDSAYIELLTPVINNAVLPATDYVSAFRSSTRIDGLNILMNKKLFYFFSGFDAKYYGSTGIGTPPNPEVNYRLTASPDLKGDTVIKIDTYNNIPQYFYNVISQDYPTLFLFQTLSRIIITTTIPVEKEVIITRENDGKPNKQEVLTDFEIPQTQLGLREYIYFYPQGDIRYINFKSTGWLDRFDMRIYFQTKDLRIYPVMISPTFEASLKIQFKRRAAHNLLQYTPNSSVLQYF